ncbi:hypothetical protein FCE95_00565 [Luteimonas gilva]|uniref:Alkaline proteinase inhibitor/ Outer membrane lipoprotein Omp19 domain-containing protein n=1 Tax=Luteimonas gilva TaxID=2572684 RepID=A0A4U5JSS2_9GAMM|nr:hypothetical protein [Luteimonas gilva]TKR32862.1 hypothetical protein FCE95_00565 [Luteimonas gilva]
MSIPAFARPVLFAAAAFAIGCSSTSTAGNASAPATPSEQSSPAVALGQTFAMSPGQTVALPDRGTLRYVGVKSDSRCPPDRQCVWAGDAEVAFEWSAGSAAPQSFGLHTGFKDKSSRVLGGHSLSLVSLARGEKPQAELRLDATP